uniref:Transposase (Putative), gypsy type n=1 Tax=Tanacetum cinerariifolium TaxID=118510 RepID=A0A6L2MJ24_TANCI|nr:hypothetical protein [Tanacetum cinerariifolium]
MDVIPKSSEFSAEHYATLVVYPASFHKYSEPFLCLVGMSRNYTLDENTYPQFLRDDDEVGVHYCFTYALPLLTMFVYHSSFLCRNGFAFFYLNCRSYEDVAPLQPKRQKKRKTKVVDVGKPSHLAKKLKDDHRAPCGPTVGGKSQSSIQRLFAGAVKNAKVSGGVMHTLPFVTSSVFTTHVRKGGDYIELLAGANLCTIGAPQRFIISSDSSDHSGVNIGEAEVDYVFRTFVLIITSATTTTTPTDDPASIAKEKLVGSSVFGVDSPSAGECHPIPGGFSDCTGSDFLIGGIRTVIDPDFNLQKMSLSAEVRMRAECDIRERRRLISIVEEKDALLKAKDKEIGSLNAQLVLKEAEAAEAVRLRVKTSKFKVVEKSLQSEVAALKERNNLLETEKSRLDVKVADLAASVKVREQEVADLNAVVHRLEASSVKLHEKVMTYENCLSQLEKLQDDQMREMNDNFDKLDTDLVEMALQLEERFYPHLLTTISGRRRLLTHGLELTIAKCLNSTEYLSMFGVAIGKAVEKGMQDELSVGITHGVEGRVLTDVVAYNPSTEADYHSALQHLHSLTESQPHVDQLMVPIHHSLDQRIVGAFALSLSLDVSSSRVRRIKENISKHRSALRDVFVSLSEPLSITAGTESTFNVIPATVDTTTALSVTSVYASLIPSISLDDYEITHTEGEKV